jgi:diguanylate cyclase (GGDEF)-like protein
MLPATEDAAGQIGDARQLVEDLGSVLPHATVYAFDRELRFLAGRGPVFRRHWLPDPERMAGRLITDALPTGAWAILREHYEAVLRGERRTFEHASTDGLGVYQLHFAPLTGPGGDTEGGLAIVHDIGAGERTQPEAERRLRHQAAVADIAARALEISDPDELLRFACERAADGSGGHGVGLLEPDGEDRLRLTASCGLPDTGVTAPPEVLQRVLRAHAPLVVDDGNRAQFRDLVGERACVLLAVENAAPGVLLIICREGGTPDAHDVRFFSAVASVLTAARDRQRLEGELRRAALHDELTALPNRTALRDHLRLGLARNQRYDTKLAVFFLDLDGFKAVNDEHGHGVGDAVLREVAGRLERALRRADLVARFGGDEFVALCETIAGTHEVDQVVARIREAFLEPFAAGDGRERLGVSIGVAVLGRDTTDPDEALDRADAEMYRAKRAGS